MALYSLMTFTRENIEQRWDLLFMVITTHFLFIDGLKQAIMHMIWCTQIHCEIRYSLLPGVVIISISSLFVLGYGSVSVFCSDSCQQVFSLRLNWEMWSHQENQPSDTLLAFLLFSLNNDKNVIFQKYFKSDLAASWTFVISNFPHQRDLLEANSVLSLKIQMNGQGRL